MKVMGAEGLRKTLQLLQANQSKHLSHVPV
jgi:hypothetical protein